MNILYHSIQRGYRIRVAAIWSLIAAALALATAAEGGSSPEQLTWTTTGSLNQAREAHTATLLKDGRVLIAGGFGKVGTVLLAGGPDKAGRETRSAELGFSTLSPAK